LVARGALNLFDLDTEVSLLGDMFEVVLWDKGLLRLDFAGDLAVEDGFCLSFSGDVTSFDRLDVLADTS
jgi:hypothetical protein